MTLPRVYQATPFFIDTCLRLHKQASHHIATVLRAKIGEELIVFNGQGGEYRAVITLIDKKGVEINIKEWIVRDTESRIVIHLAQGIARGEKMDFIMQKAVELGVQKIIPLITERCNVRLKGDREEKRWQHWQSIIISACEQSGRNYLPELSSPLTLQEWLPQVTAEHRFVLSPHAHDSLPQSTSSTFALLLGPEGGLSEDEIKQAEHYQFLPLKLGPRILRTETATIAALATLQYCYGDLK